MSIVPIGIGGDQLEKHAAHVYYCKRRSMKLLKPTWISHDGSPIFSVDIHPDGSRLATGGQQQDNDSGIVVVWNMAPVRSEKDQRNPDIPKVLCELTNHLGCVNCVRWSVDGKWLASGGDDAIVMIWQIKYQGAGGGGSGFGANLEQWGCVHMLRGHNGDVLDLSWSPDQKYLASCSVDNTLIVWNAKSLPQKVSVIAGHRGLVKGITWDPVGKYVASQSDDKTVRIWRTSDWKEERKISDPFKRCGGTTHVLRLSWSPDGKYLVSAHALNNDGPTAQIIERGDWKTVMDFVGHRKAVEVVSFNPHLFTRSGGADNHGCIAIGGRDRTLSVWLTSLKRPLVVTHDLFSDSILDLSWSTCGYELIVCSTDGTVAYICFSEKELGLPLPVQAIDELFVNMYGCKQAGSQSNVGGSSLDVLIEDPEILKLQSAAKTTTTPEKQAPSVQLPDRPLSSASQASPKKGLISDSAKAPTVTQQKETRTKEGRRRITPVLLTPQPTSLSGAPLPFTSLSQTGKSGETTSSSSAAVKDSLSQTLQKSAPSSLAPIGSPPAKPIIFEPLSPVAKRPEAKKAADTASGRGDPLEPSASEKLTKAGDKRSLESSPEKLPKAKKSKKAKTVTEGGPSGLTNKPGTPQKGSSLLAKKALGIALPYPEVQPNVTCQISTGSDGNDLATVELDNSSPTCCTVTSRRRDMTIWSSTLSSPGLLLAGNRSVTCVICKDQSLSLFSSQSGRLLLAKVILPSPPHALKCDGHHVMVVSCDAHVTVWDIHSMRAEIRRADFRHLLEGGRRLVGSSVTPNGTPILNLPPCSYMYHRDLGLWMEVASGGEYTEFQDPSFSLSRTIKETTPLDQIQTSSGTRGDVSLNMSRLQRPNSQRALLGYLESQISRSLSLQSVVEYEHWSKTYVRYLVKESLEDRLREFCLNFATPCGRDAMVLGLHKKTLLREFLLVVGGNHKLQRLYCELRDSLDTS